MMYKWKWMTGESLGREWRMKEWGFEFEGSRMKKWEECKQRVTETLNAERVTGNANTEDVFDTFRNVLLFVIEGVVGMEVREWERRRKGMYCGQKRLRKWWSKRDVNKKTLKGMHQSKWELKREYIYGMLKESEISDKRVKIEQMKTSEHDWMWNTYKEDKIQYWRVVTDERGRRINVSNNRNEEKDVEGRMLRERLRKGNGKNTCNGDRDKWDKPC